MEKIYIKMSLLYTIIVESLSPIITLYLQGQLHTLIFSNTEPTCGNAQRERP